MSDQHPDVVSLLRPLLDVVDNLERALDAAPETETDASFAEGVRGIHKQLADLLYRHDVRSFSAEGVPFDPARHEAMGQVSSDEVPPQHVVKVVRRGYFRGDVLFRPAQVIVAVEPTAERPAVPAAAVSGPRPRRAQAPERSAPNRPSWLLTQPESTGAVLFAVGRANAAQGVEEGQLSARNSALRELLADLHEIAPNKHLQPALRELASALEGRSGDDLWTPLVRALPEVERWVDDFYWEQVRGEIRGRVYDLAVLLQVPRDRLQTLLCSTTIESERWGGVELVDLGPLLEALGALKGALVVATFTGGVATRAGFKPGDIITRIGMRSIEDAASARRLLTLTARQRRPFEVEVSRAFVSRAVLRISPLRR